MCAHGSAARMLVSRVRAGTIVQPQTHVNKRAAESRCQLRHPREDDSFLSKFKPATRVSLRLDIRARLESGDRSVLVSSAVASVSAPVAMVECLICDWSYFQVADDSSTSLYPVRVLQPANQQPCTGGPGEHVPGPTCISSPVAQMSSALAQARALEEDWGLALGWLLGSTVGPIPDSVCRIVLRICSADALQNSETCLYTSKLGDRSGSYMSGRDCRTGYAHAYCCSIQATWHDAMGLGCDMTKTPWDRLGPFSIFPNLSTCDESVLPHGQMLGALSHRSGKWQGLLCHDQIEAAWIGQKPRQICGESEM